MRWIKHVVWMVAWVALAACGGGGNSGPPPFSVALNQSSLNFEYAQGTNPQPQIVSATWTGEPPGSIYVAAVIEGQGISPSIPITITNSNAQAVISVQSNVAPGVYSGRVLILVCSEPACTNRIGGSPLAINYTVRVHASILTNASPLAFQYITGAATTGATSRTLSTTTASGNWSAVASATWIQLSTTHGSGATDIGVNFNPVGLAEGTYSGQVTVTGGDGFAQSVSVQLTVSSPTLALNTGAANFVGTLGAPVPAQTIAISISNNVTGTWTATSSVPWLTLNKTSGTTPDTLQLGISNSLAPRSGNYQAEVTIDAVQGSLTLRRTISVSLSLTRPTLIVSGSPQFVGVNGSPIADRTTTIALSNGVIAPIILTPDQPWILPRAFSVTAGNSFNVGINQAAGNIGSGSFSGAILASTMLNGETISLSIPVTLTLSSPALLIANPQLSFSAINGTTIAAQSQTVSVDNGAPITLELQSNQPWLRVADTSTGAGNSIAVSVDPSVGPLASGTYNGQVLIGARLSGSLISRTINVILTLFRPTITLSESAVTLGGTKGRDSTSAPLLVSINTGTNAFAWTITGAPAWLGLDRTSGVTSTMGQNIVLTPRPQQANPGTSTATLSFTAIVNGDTLTTTLPVSYNLDSHRLVASEVGVAFVKAASWSRLTRSIKVRSNFDSPGTWSAVSNQPWLSATASGAHGSDMQVTADPSTLSPEQWYEATVTLTSSDSAIVNPERVRVGLWVGATVPVAPRTLNGDYTFIATDPIRPYVYVHGYAGGNITVIHLYTGAVVDVISIPTTALGPIAVSADGDYLFVMDRDSPTLRVVDLANRTVARSYPTKYGGVAYTQITYFRTGGVGLLNVGDQLHKAESGTVVSAGGYTSGPTGIATLDGRYSFTSRLRFTLDYADVNNGIVFSQEDGRVSSLQLNSSASPNVDGSRVTTAGSTAGGDSAPCFIVNGLTLTQLGTMGTNQYPSTSNNVATSVNNSTLCTIYFQMQPNSGDNFWLYDASGMLRTALHLGPLWSRIVDGGAKFSGDGFISVIATQDLLFNGVTYPGLTLHLVPVGP